MKVIVEGDLKELILEGHNRKYRDVSHNPDLMNGLKTAIQIMMTVRTAKELADFSFLHYEKLKYGYSGLSSVRISNRYVHRLIFEEKEDNISLYLIELDDTHYGNKKG